MQTAVVPRHSTSTNYHTDRRDHSTRGGGSESETALPYQLIICANKGTWFPPVCSAQTLSDDLQALTAAAASPVSPPPSALSSRTATALYSQTASLELQDQNSPQFEFYGASNGGAKGVLGMQGRIHM